MDQKELERILEEFSQYCNELPSRQLESGDWNGMFGRTDGSPQVSDVEFGKLLQEQLAAATRLQGFVKQITSQELTGEQRKRIAAHCVEILAANSEKSNIVRAIKLIAQRLRLFTMQEAPTVEMYL